MLRNPEEQLTPGGEKGLQLSGDLGNGEDLRPGVGELELEHVGLIFGLALLRSLKRFAALFGFLELPAEILDIPLEASDQVILPTSDLREVLLLGEAVDPSWRDME